MSTEKTELTLKQFAFEIENDIPIKTEKSPINPKTDPLNDAIYNYANKLLPKQSFFMQKNLFTTKYPQSKINSVLNKLVKFYKNSNITVSYVCRLQRDAEKNITGYRVWRVD